MPIDLASSTHRQSSSYGTSAHSTCLPRFVICVCVCVCVCRYLSREQRRTPGLCQGALNVLLTRTSSQKVLVCPQQRLKKFCVLRSLLLHLLPVVMSCNKSVMSCHVIWWISPGSDMQELWLINELRPRLVWQINELHPWVVSLINGLHPRVVWQLNELRQKVASLINELRPRVVWLINDLCHSSITRVTHEWITFCVTHQRVTSPVKHERLFEGLFEGLFAHIKEACHTWNTNDSLQIPTWHVTHEWVMQTNIVSCHWWVAISKLASTPSTRLPSTPWTRALCQIKQEQQN